MVYTQKKEKERICKICKKKFIPKTHSGTKQFCGYTCSNKDTAQKRKAKAAETRICKRCSKPFTKARSMFPKNHGGKYCSRKCMGDDYAKTNSISRWKAKVWFEFSKFIRRRDNWTCFTCGVKKEGGSMHAGHFVSRRHNSTLFDLKNVHAQCVSCNMYRNGEPHIYAKKIIDLYGLDEFNNLVKRGREIKKFTKMELMELFNKYKGINKLEELKTK